MTLRSSIYSGWVMHSRLTPRIHSFRYRVWWILVDLDELSALDRSLHLFSHNRFNVLALHDRDYGHANGPLRAYVETKLADAGLPSAASRIQLLTMPRILGYAFNPLSIYFCRDASDRVAAIIYEVHNTFGERHSYVIEATANQGGIVRQIANKAFYVSPFMDMSMQYAFRVCPPAEAVSVDISGRQNESVTIRAALAGKRVNLTTLNLLRCCATYPLLTLKVMGAIHWQAIRLWLKGIAVRPRDANRGHAANLASNVTPARRSHG
jgi:uncharacterized protein